MGAGLAKVQVVALEHAQALRIQAQLLTLLMEMVNAGIQPAVEQDAAVVSRQTGGHFPLGGLQLGVGVRRGQVVKDPAYSIQSHATALQRHDGVVKSGRRFLPGHPIDFFPVFLHGQFKGGQVVGRLDLFEGRQPKRGLPVTQERVGHGVLAVLHCCHMPLKSPEWLRLTASLCVQPRSVSHKPPRSSRETWSMAWALTRVER